MNDLLLKKIELLLLFILREISTQTGVASFYPPDVLGFSDQMKQLQEYIEVAGEYEIAYESIVATLEAYPFVLSGKAAIALLEVGLILGYKTDRKEDNLFDRR